MDKQRLIAEAAAAIDRMMAALTAHGDRAPETVIAHGVALAEVERAALAGATSADITAARTR